MELLLCDRVFWIYFILFLFFTIIGAALIFSASAANQIAVSLIWITGMLILTFMAYFRAVEYKVGDRELSCLDPCEISRLNDNRTLIGISFIILSILAVIWAGEFNSGEKSQPGAALGLFMIIGGLFLIAQSCNHKISLPLMWLSMLYILIWTTLTLVIA